MKSALRGAWSIAGSVRRPPRYPAGHYYSPHTSRADEERAIAWGRTREAPAGVALDEVAMRRLAEELAPMWPDVPEGGRYHANEMFGRADAAVYQAILRTFRPARVLEVGSGFSTAVALDTIDAHSLPTSITCIEPYPQRLRSLLRPTDTVTLHELPVQEVPIDTFTALQPGDVLFIDSTHVAKPGSDVVWNLLTVLPRLTAGVIVHIHDMFWPFEYPESWLRERRDWNELYLVHAFLSHNEDWEVLLFNDWVWQEHPDLVRTYAADTAAERPGGLWLRRRERPGGHR